MTCSTMMMVMPRSRSERMSSMPSAQFGRIETREPLVEQQQVRIEGERTGQFQPLLVDVGEAVRRYAAPPGKADVARAGSQAAASALPHTRLRRGMREPTITFSTTVMDGRTRTSWKVRATPRGGDAVGARPADRAP